MPVCADLKKTEAPHNSFLISLLILLKMQNGMNFITNHWKKYIPGRNLGIA